MVYMPSEHKGAIHKGNRSKSLSFLSLYTCENQKTEGEASDCHSTERPDSITSSDSAEGSETEWNNGYAEGEKPAKKQMLVNKANLGPSGQKPLTHEIWTHVKQPGGNPETNTFISDGSMSLPAFWKTEAVAQLQQQWTPRAGDVFVAAHFPIRGLQRLLVSLVEGHANPWALGRVDKPHFADAAASKRGAQKYLEEIDTWQGRRFFKTHAFPDKFPSRPVYDWDGAPGKGPKILVLIADPRHAFTVWWDAICHKNCSLAEFVSAVAGGEFNLFGNFFEHANAWAQEAERHPDCIRLVDAGRLGSLDPKQVKAELEVIAEFIGTPMDCVEELVASTFRRPEDADMALAADCMTMSYARNGGHLVEPTGKNLVLFEDAVSGVARETHQQWTNMLRTWLECSSTPFLAELAQTSMRGISSTPPMALTDIAKGPLAHATGTCRPCVFNLRGICRNSADMCMYCHELGHLKTKRASQRVRKARKTREERQRTPSPSPAMVDAYSGMYASDMYAAPSDAWAKLQAHHQPVMMLPMIPVMQAVMVFQA